LFPYAELIEGQGRSLQVFTVYEGNTLVGIAPLQVSPRKLVGLKRIQFIGHQFSDYCDIICRKNYERPVVETLLRYWKSIFGCHAIFDLHHVPESSNTPLVLRAALRELGGQIHEIPWEKALALNLADGRNIKTDKLEKILSKKHGRQRIKEMEKLGKTKISIIRDEEGLQSNLERLFYYHRLRWHERKTYVHSMSDELRNVYTKCISRMTGEGNAELVSLVVNDLPYAYAIALKKGKFFYYLMPVHNIFARYSPGTSLLYHIFAYVKNDEYQELDFTIGEEPYKSRFSNAIRQNQRLFFTFNSSMLFAKTMELVDHVRSSERLIEHIRRWRTKSHQVRYSLKDYLSRRISQLGRLNYELIKLHVRSLLSDRSCLIYRLNLADVYDPGRVERNSHIQKVSAIEAIKFICQFHHSNAPALWRDLLKREIEGAECYGLFVDNKLVHTSWVTEQQAVMISEIGDSLSLKDGEGCIFDCNTLREYRGQGAYPKTLMHIARLKKESGCKCLFVYSLPSNISSIRGIEKAGFELVEIRRPTANNHHRFWK
jgi:CelD/BcsL family acetyltransferase involved in cellulose biosynthesis